MIPCSRREAEQYIAGGWVSVNGLVIEEPMYRVDEQTVTIDPNASLMVQTDVTFLLHKPPGYDTLAALGEANRHIKPAQQLLKPDTHAETVVRKDGDFCSLLGHQSCLALGQDDGPGAEHDA